MACILSLWALRLLLCVDSTSVLSLKKEGQYVNVPLYNLLRVFQIICLGVFLLI